MAKIIWVRLAVFYSNKTAQRWGNKLEERGCRTRVLKHTNTSVVYVPKSCYSKAYRLTKDWKGDI